MEDEKARSFMEMGAPYKLLSQISCPGHLVNKNIKKKAPQELDPYALHLGYCDLQKAIKSVLNTDILTDAVRENIVDFLYNSMLA